MNRKPAVLACVQRIQLRKERLMKTDGTYRKVGMRYLTLLLLGMALMIVAKPQHAMATTPCVQNCLLQEQFCIATCPKGMSCAQECASQFNTCRFEC